MCCRCAEQNTIAKEGCSRKCIYSSSSVAHAGECRSCQADVKEMSALSINMEWHKLAEQTQNRFQVMKAIHGKLQANVCENE